jgi:hypothetical protein
MTESSINFEAVHRELLKLTLLDRRMKLKDKLDPLAAIRESAERSQAFERFLSFSAMTEEELDQICRDFDDADERVELILDRDDQAIADNPALAAILTSIVHQISKYEDQLGLADEARWCGPLERHRRDMKKLEQEMEVQRRRREARREANAK